MTLYTRDKTRLYYLSQSYSDCVATNFINHFFFPLGYSLVLCCPGCFHFYVELVGSGNPSASGFQLSGTKNAGHHAQFSCFFHSAHDGLEVLDSSDPPSVSQVAWTTVQKVYFIFHLNKMQWHTPLIPGFKRLKQEDHSEFEASMNCTVS